MPRWNELSAAGTPASGRKLQPAHPNFFYRLYQQALTRRQQYLSVVCRYILGLSSDCALRDWPIVPNWEEPAKKWISHHAMNSRLLKCAAKKPPKKERAYELPLRPLQPQYLPAVGMGLPFPQHVMAP
jgi:hypothetical protein